MSMKASLVFAAPAGFLGGAVSHYVVPVSVYAQTQGTAPQEIRSRKFVLVDEKGVTRGVFGFGREGQPEIQISSKGHVLSPRWLDGIRKKNRLLN